MYVGFDGIYRVMRGTGVGKSMLSISHSSAQLSDTGMKTRWLRLPKFFCVRDDARSGYMCGTASTAVRGTRRGDYSRDANCCKGRLRYTVEA